MGWSNRKIKLLILRCGKEWEGMEESENQWEVMKESGKE